MHWTPAHTSGDLAVYLPAEKTVFTGDIISPQQPDPIIHIEKNGSSEGWIATTKGMVALNGDRFVPGMAIYRPRPLFGRGWPLR